MPLGQLSRVERERLGRFPATIAGSDLREFFGLVGAASIFVRSRRGEANRLGLAVQLGCLRFLGFVPELDTVPAEVVEFVARQLDVPAGLLGDYGQRDQTRSDHLVAVMEHMGFVAMGDLEAKRLRSWLVEPCMDHVKATVLFEHACGWLRSERVMRPAVSAVERLIASAVVEADHETYRRIDGVLTQDVRGRLDALLEGSDEISTSRLVWLRQGVNSVTPGGVLAGLDKVGFLRSLGADEFDLSAISTNRVRHLARLARAASPQHLSRYNDERRYAILAAFAATAVPDLVDETLDVFCSTLGRATARTRRAHREEIADHGEQIRGDWAHLIRIAELVMEAANTGTDAVDLIGAQVGLGHVAELVERASDAPIGPDRFFDLLERRHSWMRQFTPAVIEAFEFQSLAGDPDIVDAIAILAELNRTGTRTMPPDAPRSFASGRWRRQIEGADGALERHRWEQAVMYELRDRLRSGDVWVAAANRYADPEALVISHDRFVDIRADFHRLTGTKPTSTAHLDRLRTQTRDAANRLEERLGNGVNIVDGRPKLAALESQSEDRDDLICDAIGELLPRVDIAEILSEVNGWCGWTEPVTHAGAASPRSEDHQKLLYASVLTQACNLGITTMGQISDVSTDQLAWTTDWYLREETLKAAVTALVNYHHKLPGAALWGSGTLSSSDGQRFPVPVEALNATALPKYFNRGRGVEMYTWTSDQYSQYGSKVVPATVRDATHILDEILDNEIDLPIAEHTSDTAGYTDLIFGLFDLLGLSFAPRIRNLTDQRFYQLDDLSATPAVASMARHSINTDLIDTHWDDMIRIAASLKTGDVTASLIVSRLQAGARRNQLTKAIQELGRAAKTRFLFTYLEDETYRRRIGRQLNKGETLHALRQFIFFANGGQIRHRRPEDQTNQALCLNLVTNAVIVWNTVYVHKAIEHLTAQGFITDHDDLSRTSPTQRTHINPYGRYTFENEPANDTLRPLRNIERSFAA